MFRLFGGLVPASLAALAAILALVALPVRAATISVPVSGTSAAGNPVGFLATFTTSGSTLSLVLSNTSSFPTTAPADVLSSFYFDVFQDGVRPSLTFVAASGLVYEVRRNAGDVFVPGSLPGGATDLLASSTGAGTWQFRTMNPASAPLLGFGIGTVGNSALSPNNFDPKIVDQADYTIYSTGTGTDIDPVGNLRGRLLVRGAAAFTFAGLTPERPVVVQDRFAFGLGTTPDSIIVAVPEPAAAALVLPGTIAVLVAAWIRRRRPEPSRPRPTGAAAS
jgi:hypothetical protein